MRDKETISDLANLWYGTEPKNCWSQMQSVMALKKQIGEFPPEGKDYASGIAKVCLAVYDRLPSSVSEPAPQPMWSLEPVKESGFW